MSDQTIIKTEIQGIQAIDLLTYLGNLENRLIQLQQSVKPPQKTTLLTRKDVAELLSISLPTLHSWTKKELLISYRIGNKVRYKQEEVLQALQNINLKNQTDEKVI